MKKINFCTKIPLKSGLFYGIIIAERLQNRGNMMSKCSKKRYALDEFVSYRKNGVCKIVDITVQSFGGQGKKEYYVLQSVYDANMRVFVPIGSDLENEMKNIVSSDEIIKIIGESKNVESLWVDDCKSRAGVFEEIINSGDLVKMLWMIQAVNDYKKEAELQKKKMKATDLKYLAMAESIISGEFAFSLGINKNEVIDYINKLLAE